MENKKLKSPCCAMAKIAPVLLYVEHDLINSTIPNTTPANIPKIYVPLKTEPAGVCFPVGLLGQFPRNISFLLSNF
jgi:hypothetical protein